MNERRSQPHQGAVTHTLAAAVLQQEAGEPVADDRYLELARTLEFTRAELDVYRSTFGQRDTGITPSTGAVKLTDEQHTLAHKVKVLAEIALGRGTKLPLHTRRKNLCAAIDELAALATPQVSPPQARVPLTKKRLSEVLQETAEGIDSMSIVMTHWEIVARAIERAHLIGLETKE